MGADAPLAVAGIARQQWRARIETTPASCALAITLASPASNGGRGLKRHLKLPSAARKQASPASNGERGLKLSLVA